MCDGNAGAPVPAIQGKSLRCWLLRVLAAAADDAAHAQARTWAQRAALRRRHKTLRTPPSYSTHSLRSFYHHSSARTIVSESQYDNRRWKRSSSIRIFQFSTHTDVVIASVWLCALASIHPSTDYVVRVNLSLKTGLVTPSPHPLFSSVEASRASLRNEPLRPLCFACGCEEAKRAFRATFQIRILARSLSAALG